MLGVLIAVGVAIAFGRRPSDPGWSWPRAAALAAGAGGPVRGDPVHRCGRRRRPRRGAGQRRHGLAPVARRLDRRALQARAGPDRPGLSARPARPGRGPVRRSLHASSIDVFAGLTLAIPALTALVAFGALEGLGQRPRVIAAALVALPYLAAAYLAQEAFKEPIMALFVLTFALLLARARDWRDAIPLGVIAAGVVYVYSFPGLAWLGGVACVWGAIELVRQRRDRRNGRYASETSSSSVKAVLIGVGVAIAVLLVLVAPDAERLRDFADFRALHPDQANEGGLGNLPGQLNPLEALGIWPTSEFRLSASASSLPAVLFYLGGAFALACLVLALPRWVRHHGPAIPAALDRGRGSLPARAGPRHRLHLRQGALDRRSPHRPRDPRRAPGERPRGAARARRRLRGARRVLLLPDPAPGSRRADGPRRRARGDTPARPGRETPVPWPRQLRPVRAARLASLHPRAQLLRPLLRRAELRAHRRAGRSSTSTR